MTRIELELNGARSTLEVEPQAFLLDVLRDDLGLTGAKLSCDSQVCGACTVLVDGAPVSACSYLAVETDGRTVTTIEGFRETPAFEPIAAAFTRHAALQCGFCTPGMVLTVHALLEDGELDGRGLDPARPGGQPVSLHRLPRDPECRQRRGRRARRPMTTIAPPIARPRSAPQVGPFHGPRRRRREAAWRGAVRG